MSFNFAPYQGFSGRCSGYARPGAKAWMAYTIDRFPEVYSLGIYNCRPPSIHSDGRADDFGIKMIGGRANVELGMQLVNLYGPFGKRLGITEMIFNRAIWSANSPNGRYYGGASPHYDHMHGGLTLAAAMNLTYATLVAVLGPATPTPAPSAPATTVAFPKGAEGLPGGGYSADNMEGKGKDGNVQTIQQGVNRHLVAQRLAPIKEDGFFGAKTGEAIEWFQRVSGRGLQVDGVVGPRTWAELWK